MAYMETAIEFDPGVRGLFFLVHKDGSFIELFYTDGALEDAITEYEIDKEIDPAAMFNVNLVRVTSSGVTVIRYGDGNMPAKTP